MEKNDDGELLPLVGDIWIVKKNYSDEYIVPAGEQRIRICQILDKWSGYDVIFELLYPETIEEEDKGPSKVHTSLVRFLRRYQLEIGDEV